MSEETMSVEIENKKLTLRKKELELKLKELEVADKEYQQKNRPSVFKASITNPAAIAALIAAWASVSAAGITWIAGSIAADSQRELDQRKFDADLIVNAIKTNDPTQAETNLRFLLVSGLLQITRLKGVLRTI